MPGHRANDGSMTTPNPGKRPGGRLTIKKKNLLIVFVLAILAWTLSGCGATEEQVRQIVSAEVAPLQAEATLQAEQTPIPFEVTRIVTEEVEVPVEVTRIVTEEVEVPVEVTRIVTEIVTNTVTITTTAPLTFTGVISPGALAWHQDTNMDRWEASPVGYLNSTLPMVVETWGLNTGCGSTSGASTLSYVVILPAGSVMWLQCHFGGSGFWLAEDADLEAVAEDHVETLLQRDGVEAQVVMLPEDNFLNLGCLQEDVIINQTRTCVEVGGQEAFSMTVGAPFPGYFPQQNTTMSITGTVPLSGTTGAITTPASRAAGVCNGTEVSGPAIIEDGTAGFAAKINSGEDLEWSGVGNCWPVDSQVALETAWADHVPAFRAKYPNAPVYERTADIP